MSSIVSACKRLGVLAWLGACPLLALGQERFSLQGGEYPIVGALQGDQVSAQLALGPSGGYLVWHDNATDGLGFGISAQRINQSLSGSLGSFRVNENAPGDQTLPQLALLGNGGAVFTWQSAIGAGVKVYARFLKPDGTFATGDIAVSNFTSGDQTSPVVASLSDGNVLVVWTSIGQERTSSGQEVANGMQGVFGQRFSPTGEKLGTEFQINSTASYNQRNPALASLENGNLLVVWVSESYKGVRHAIDANGRTEAGGGLDLFDVIVKGQIFGAEGTKVGTELSLSSSSLVAANPVVTGMKEGFTVAWSGRPNHSLSDSELNESWDIYARQFTLLGSPKQSEFRVNTFTYGDQFRPQICNQDGINFVLWTTLKQDGSWEGVVGRLISDGAQFLSKEFRVNTSTVGKQIFPTVGANSNHSFLAVWSSFVGGVSSFDLLAQRYASAPEQGLAAPAAPYVSAISQTRLSVTWPALAGYTGVKYELYVDESSSPIMVENNSTVVTSLAPNSTHGFRLAYVLTDGRKSPLSSTGTGKTWSEDDNFDGLPDDWQGKFWGANAASWPSSSSDSDGDGATNLQELLAGTDPSDAQSVLRVQMIPTTQGPRLEWNTEAGCIYQVQMQDDPPTWVSVGTPRFAAGVTDSIPVDSGKVIAIYRVIRLR